MADGIRPTDCSPLILQHDAVHNVGAAQPLLRTRELHRVTYRNGHRSTTSPHKRAACEKECPGMARFSFPSDVELGRWSGGDARLDAKRTEGSVRRSVRFFTLSSLFPALALVAVFVAIDEYL